MWGKKADDVAANLLEAIAQDIGERWNSTVRSNAIEALESCLLLTQSNCAVPKPLRAELKFSSLSLSQYLQKSGLVK